MGVINIKKEKRRGRGEEEERKRRGRGEEEERKRRGEEEDVSGMRERCNKS